MLAKVSLGSDGLTYIRDISISIKRRRNSYDINRTRATNDLHGLGAFLVMDEQLRRTGG